MQSRTLVIVPSYNEEKVVAQTLKGLRPLPVDILVVDDGSHDQTGAVAGKYADYLITHRRNCGLGAALATGIEFAKRSGYDYCLTFDADGQHDPKDLGKALAKLRQGYDVVIGSRFLGTVSGLRPSRRVILWLGNLVTWFFFGIWTSDSQSGFRGLGKKAIQSLNLRSNRMEVSSEFFGEIHRLGLKFTEIPIHIRYTAYSLSKGQKSSNSARVLVKLLYQLSR